jgi:hypothetical protein
MTLIVHLRFQECGGPDRHCLGHFLYIHLFFQYNKIKTLIDARKEVGLEVNTEKLTICCCPVTRMQGKIMT